VHISDPLVAETILRVVQEAMTNAAKHADADTLSVSLHHEGSRILLDIEDDGKMRGPLREGNGIAGMRERVASADGRLDLRRSERGGMRLQVSLPA
ncbi:MAG: ATP-binding protein, partial [Pseudoxanthomonas sp.]